MTEKEKENEGVVDGHKEKNKRGGISIERRARREKHRRRIPLGTQTPIITNIPTRFDGRTQSQPICISTPTPPIYLSTEANDAHFESPDTTDPHF